MNAARVKGDEQGDEKGGDKGEVRPDSKYFPKHCCLHYYVANLNRPAPVVVALWPIR
jgi:hypothetical protein